LVAQTEIGKQVAVKVLRNGNTQLINIVLGTLPKTDKLAQQSKKEPAKPEAKQQTVLGMTLKDLDSNIRKRTEISTGVFIAAIEEGVAKQADLRQGDIIALWDGKKVESVAQLTQTIAATSKGQSVAVLVHRDGSARFLAIKVPE
jgi:serine protease Do